MQKIPIMFQLSAISSVFSVSLICIAMSFKYGLYFKHLLKMLRFYCI